MKALLMIFSWACLGCASSNSAPPKEQKAAAKVLGEEVPGLFKTKEFSCATLVEAANHYIAMGEGQAIKKLKALEEDYGDSMKRGFHRNERIGWVCRVVFNGAPGKPLRPPMYGGLSLPRLTMPMARWPRYPVAESDGVFFVLSEGYMLAGRAERASDYLDYCRNTGTFRKTKVKVPSQDEARKAFTALIDAKRWKAIKWKDEGPGTKYTMSEDWVLSGMEAQATAVSEKQGD